MRAPLNAQASRPVLDGLLQRVLALHLARRPEIFPRLVASSGTIPVRMRSFVIVPLTPLSTSTCNDIMAIFIVRHITTYRYKRDIRLGRHQLMARPRDSFDQRLIDFSLDVTPRPSEVRWLHDVFGNCVAQVEFDCASDRLRFECVIKVDHTPENAPNFRIEDYAT